MLLLRLAVVPRNKSRSGVLQMQNLAIGRAGAGSRSTTKPQEVTP